MQLGKYTVFTSIAHAGHRPERRASLQKMTEQLRLGLPDPVTECSDWVVIDDQLPPHEWSYKQWCSAENTYYDLSHGLFLNDDLEIPSDFWQRLESVIAERPDDILSLYCSSPKAVGYHAAGHRFYTSSDGLIGNAYVMPLPVLTEFMDWRETELCLGAIRTLSEDQLVNLFAMATGRRIWHTIPSLVEHASLPSLYGNDNQPARKSTVPPGASNGGAYNPAHVVHAGRLFRGNHWSLLLAIRPECWEKYRCVERAYEIERDVVK